MLRLILRRLTSLVPILLIVSAGVFLLSSLVPGDPALRIAGPTATPERVEQIRTQYHFDDPLVVQYGRWLGDTVQFDFGTSRQTGQPVSSEVGSRLPVTVSLVFAATVFACVFGLVLGLVSAMRPGRFADSMARLLSTIGMSVPNFVMAILLLLLFAVQRQTLPVSGYVAFGDSPIEWLQHIALPAITLGFILAAIVGRQLRSAMLDTLDKDFVRAAWARGGGTFNVVGKHALKNSAIPAVTVVGLQVAALIGGAVIIEQIFALPGLGPMMLNAVQGQDLPVVQAVTVVFVLAQVGMSLVVDICYGLLNPKVRVS